MSNGKLTFTLGGREALPVRAIPYVTGWQMSPDVVARSMAKDEPPPPFPPLLRNLQAFHLPDDIAVEILPREWDATVASLEGYQAELKQQHPDDAIGYAAWRKDSAAKLPAGVFVWLDEFASERKADRGKVLQGKQRRGDEELILSPMLDDQTKAMVSDGFGQRKLHAANIAIALFDFGYWSAVARHFGAVDWRYWLSLKSWTAREGACLLTELNPDDYDLVVTNGNPQSLGLVRRVGDIERRACRDGQAGQLQANPSPLAWTVWADANEYALPNSMIQFVNEKVCAESTASDKPASPELTQASPLELNATVMVSNIVTNNHYFGSARVSAPDNREPHKASQEELVPDEKAHVAMSGAAATVAPGAGATVAPIVRIKRAALIRKYEREWSAIEDDLRHANENGLRKVAKILNEHGYWNELAVVQWGNERGKLQVKQKLETPKLDALTNWGLRQPS